MGRITIFSLKTCPHCRKAKARFDELGWEYAEVSLTDYPEKRSDMLQLADRLTVPQIFFNERHMGGASDVEQMLSDGSLAKIYDDMVAAPEPTDQRFFSPNYPPKEEVQTAPLTEEILCIGSECWQYADVAALLDTGLSVSDHSYHGRTYKQTFVGSEAVDFLCSRFPELRSRVEAVQVGNSLLDSKLFHHVTHDHAFKDEKLFYRLQTHSEPHALNTWRKWSDRVDTPLLTLKMCRKALSALQNKHMDSDGRIDYVALAEDDGFASFQESTCEFQLVDAGAMAETTRLAFFINLYNLAVLHAFAAVGIAKSNLKRLSFFDTVGYVVGGAFFSLNDMENGILRGNRTAPFHLSPPFSASDPRLSLALPQGEARIHFALNCGAKSCPPIKEFSAEAVDEELRISAMAFCEMPDNLEISSTHLKVTKILSWYRKDFGNSDLEVATKVLGWLRGEQKAGLQVLVDQGKVKIKYFEYDWTTNAKNSKTYSPETFKQNPGGCCLS